MLKVEGVEYRVNWRKFRPGASFFIPCLKPKRTRRQLKPLFRRLGVEVIVRRVIENGIQGLRIWRV